MRRCPACSTVCGRCGTVYACSCQQFDRDPRKHSQGGVGTVGFGGVRRSGLKSAFEMLLHRVETLEDKDKDTTEAFGDAYKRIQHLEKAVQHRDKKESRPKPAD